MRITYVICMDQFGTVVAYLGLAALIAAGFGLVWSS